MQYYLEILRVIECKIKSFEVLGLILRRLEIASRKTIYAFTNNVKILLLPWFLFQLMC